MRIVNNVIASTLWTTKTAAINTTCSAGLPPLIIQGVLRQATAAALCSRQAAIGLPWEFLLDLASLALDLGSAPPLDPLSGATGIASNAIVLLATLAGSFLTNCWTLDDHVPLLKSSMLSRITTMLAESLQQHSFSPLAGLLVLLLTSLLGVHGSEQMTVLTSDQVSLAQASQTGKLLCSHHSICLLSWSVSKHKMLSDATGIAVRQAWWLPCFNAGMP